MKQLMVHFWTESFDMLNPGETGIQQYEEEAIKWTPDSRKSGQKKQKKKKKDM